MSTGRPWLGRLRPAKISVPHVAETLLDIRGGLDKIVPYASPWSSGKPAKRGRVDERGLDFLTWRPSTSMFRNAAFTSFRAGTSYLNPCFSGWLTLWCCHFHHRLMISACVALKANGPFERESSMPVVAFLTSSNVVSGFANNCLMSSRMVITTRSFSFASRARCCDFAPPNQTRKATIMVATPHNNSTCRLMTGRPTNSPNAKLTRIHRGAPIVLTLNHSRRLERPLLILPKFGPAIYHALCHVKHPDKHVSI